MARKKQFRLRDDAPTGTPDRMPAKTGRRACEACAVVGPKATVQLCLRRTGRPPGKLVGNATDVCTLMRGVEEADRESFYTLHLDTRHRIIDVDRVAVGSLSGVEVHPREVFKSALLSGAAAVIFVHNHPSGTSEPSRMDLELTSRLRQVGELVGIPVLDHIIVGHDSAQGNYPTCNSLASKGMLGEGCTDKYTPIAEKPPKK